MPVPSLGRKWVNCFLVQQMKRTIKLAFQKSLPVMAGYIVLGIGFGILLKDAGYGLFWSFLMGLTIYAGSMQYVAVSLLTAGASLITVALTTLMVNARHLFYGVSMIDKYKDAGRKKPYLICSLTDETYSLLCDGQIPEGFDIIELKYVNELGEYTVFPVGITPSNHAPDLEHPNKPSGSVNLDNAAKGAYAIIVSLLTALVIIAFIGLLVYVFIICFPYLSAFLSNWGGSNVQTNVNINLSDEIDKKKNEVKKDEEKTD